MIRVIVKTITVKVKCCKFSLYFTVGPWQAFDYISHSSHLSLQPISVHVNCHVKLKPPRSGVNDFHHSDLDWSGLDETVPR